MLKLVLSQQDNSDQNTNNKNVLKSLNDFKCSIANALQNEHSCLQQGRIEIEYFILKLNPCKTIC